MPENRRLRRVWRGMIQRCNNPSHISYHSYGGRGITVCKEWYDYKIFEEWAIRTGYDKTAPYGKCTLERIDVNKGYCPENCCWATIKQQNLNKTSSHIIEYNGEKKTAKEWADQLGINYHTLIGRFNICGYSPEKAFIKRHCKGKLITFNGETHNIPEWSKILGINYWTLYSRTQKEDFDPKTDFIKEDKRRKRS